MSAIEIKKLYFSYELESIFQGVSLSISQGEFIGIIGPNGGGKTTFLKLLLGFLKPTSGSISIFKKDPKKNQELIGYVPQRFSVDRSFPLTVLDLVLQGALLFANSFGKIPKQMIQKAHDLLIEFEIDSFSKKPFKELSGGELQRALLARALLHNPKILILDEATSCIDIKGEKKIFDFLLREKGKKTILFVSHDLKIFSKGVDKILSIHRSLQFIEANNMCDHFEFGVYHEPIILKKENKS